MELLYEPSKRIACVGIAVSSLVAAVFSFVTKNSKFLEPCIGGTVPSIILMIILCLGFLSVSAHSFFILTVPGREKKFAALVKIRGERRSFEEEKKFNKKYSKTENARKINRRITNILSVVIVLCFAAAFILGTVLFTVTEFKKPPIERTIGGYRLVVDFISSLMFLLSVIIYVISSQFIIRNRNFPSFICFASVATNVISTVHFTYFCLGNFTNYPSVIDGSVAFLGVIFALFSYLSVMTEKKKKVLKGWNDRSESVYDF